VAWTIRPESRDAAVAGGLARQWTLVAGSELPPLLALVAAAPTWLAAWIRARSLAGDDARAHGCLDAYEQEIATVTGHAVVRWPSRLRKTAAVRPTSLALPALDPTQQLVCTGALVHQSAPVTAALAALLHVAWAEPPGLALASDLRVRVCAVALPASARAQWLRGTGLSPPDDVVPGEHRGGVALLGRAFADGGARPVPLGHSGSLRPAAALDLLLAAATVRACLRVAGELGSSAVTSPAELAVAASACAPIERVPARAA